MMESVAMQPHFLPTLSHFHWDGVILTTHPCVFVFYISAAEQGNGLFPQSDRTTRLMIYVGVCDPYGH